MRRKSNILLHLDWNLIILYLVLIFIGWINIYATSKTDTSTQFLDFSIQYGKQIGFIASSFILILFILSLDSKFYINFASIFYLLAIFSLVGLFIFGKTVNGATSWYAIGSFSLQPSEFSKIGIALGVAKLLGDKQFDMSVFQNQLKAFLLIFIPIVLITLQPDAGSAIVFITFFFVFHREGLPKYYIIVGFIFISLAISIFKFGYFPIEIILFILFILFIFYLYRNNKYFLRRYWMQYILIYLATSVFIFAASFSYNNILPKHQKERIDLILGIIKDNKGSGYNQLQSQIAVGNGGAFGKGYLNGQQTNGNFVPEQHTDFIFSAVAEQFGFIGSIFVLGLYIVFILRILHISERQKLKFARIYGYAIASVFFIHFTINIGMVLGVLPTIGIPLPYLSYGGSSLWAFTILLFIFIRLDANNYNEI